MRCSSTYTCPSIFSFTSHKLTHSPSLTAALSSTLVQGFWNWDNREQLIEYDDEDRYEKDQREAARTVTKLFQQAARSKRAPLLTDLIEIIALNENDGGEERLRSSRTIRDLINLVEDDGSEQEPISKPVVQVVTNRQIMRQPRSPRDSTSPTKAAPPPTAAFEQEVKEEEAPPRPPPLSIASSQGSIATGSTSSMVSTNNDDAEIDPAFIIPPLPEGIDVIWPVLPTPEEEEEEVEEERVDVISPPKPITPPEPTPKTVISKHPTQEEAPLSEAIKDGPESSRRRVRSPVASTAGAAAAATAAVAEEKKAAAVARPGSLQRGRTVAALPTRGGKENAPLLMGGEFTADDILLWLQTSAFKKRPQAGRDMHERTAAGRRERIVDEVRRLKTRIAQPVS